MTDEITDPNAAAAVKTERPPESGRKSLWPDVKYGFAMLGQYLRKHPILGSFLVIYQFAQTGIATMVFLQNNLAIAGITNSLAAKNSAPIPGLMVTVVGYSLAVLIIAVIGVWARFSLRIRVRRVLTHSFLNRWLDDNRFYHLEQRAALDYPEQRIQEDLYQYIDKLTQLGPTILGSLFSVFLYTAQLWRLSPPLTFPSIGLVHPIPGFLVFVAFAFGIGMTVLIHLVGSILTRAEVVRQRLEAQFRSEMGAIRDNGESVAFARGAEIERTRLSNTFMLIVKNWRYFTFANLRITLVAGIPEGFMPIAPALFCAPFVLSGQMQLGDMALVGMSFGQVYVGIGMLVLQYSELAILRSSVARLRFLHEALSAPITSSIKVSETADNVVSARGLEIAFPDGSPMVSIGEIDIPSGRHLLIQGRCAGKSTPLLRSVAGLWPYGSGTVNLPNNASIAFLPQRAYMPTGTLASLMSYPQPPNAHTDAEYADLLTQMGLERLVPRLHDYQPWSRILSPGEQQRLAGARAILANPSFLFLDEATSALDVQSESKLYKLIGDRLPASALISVAHRPTVAQFHDTLLQIENGRATIGPIAAGSAPA